MRTRYQPVEDGYWITGSRELFNRTLYGAHAHDDRPERYFTFAGDLPLVMGAATDWSQNKWGNYAKSGVLFSGLALTPGMQTPAFYSEDVDTSSHWFHNSEDSVAVFRNGWIEYELRQFSAWFPDVSVNITVLPLMPEDGFLMHYRIRTDQRILFCAGFGGITDYISRLEYALVKARSFHAQDCRNNTVKCGRNRALVTGPRGTAMWIGASFPVEVGLGDASVLQDGSPALFLAGQPSQTTPHVVKMHAAIGAGETLDGFVVAIRNEDERVLDQWLNCDRPVERLQREIRHKHSSVAVRTPDAMLDLTIPPTVLAMDASWHKNTFYHGAHAYHVPFLGWRNWYGPTVIGWHDRVETAIKTHFAEIPKSASGPEEVWYDGKSRPDLDHEGSQYHQIRNSTGFIPSVLGGNDIYNMQEVAIDMLLHHLDWTGDLGLAERLFEDMKGVLDWEGRILDPDRDGLYQNFLNTWISDGHSYNGGGCAQASAYNYRANLLMSRIAEKLNRNGEGFQQRSAAIRKAVQSILWIPAKGVVAEFIDTIGNRLLHPSPELATAYLAIDCGVVDPFQAYQMLRFTETELCNEATLHRKGRLVYSSNWYPKKYSTCGIFPAENAHLALAYYQSGLPDRGWALLSGIVDSYFLGKNPGLSSHVLTGRGAADGGDLDFSDVSSTYLRLIVEGLFGIRFRLMDNLVEIAPSFPPEWTQASIQLKDLSLEYSREGQEETLAIQCRTPARKIVRLPLRSSQITAVLLDGKPVEYRTQAAVNRCFLEVDLADEGSFQLQVIYGDQPVPSLSYSLQVVEGGDLTIEVKPGTVTAIDDPSGSLRDVSFSTTTVRAKMQAAHGSHAIFVRVTHDQFDAWLPAGVTVEKPPTLSGAPGAGDDAARMFEPADISRHFNCSLHEIHTQEYRSPRPKGYSIGVQLNGRYAWDWNQGGHNAVRVDDTALRNCRGIFRSPSGIAFSTPAIGQQLACVSIWDNFPTVINIPLQGKASELALLLIGVTNPMQSRVENARITVTYADRSQQAVSLVHPENFDDWLNAALQQANETAYFSDYNHGMVQRIHLDPEKELASLSIEAIANEVIVGLLGISIRRRSANGELLR